MTDEEALNAYLDMHPGDMGTRLVLSDLYEEQGRIEDAVGQRYLVSGGKWPTRGFGTGINSAENPWDWWREEQDFGAPLNSLAPTGMFSWENKQCRYATRRDAEEDYIAYARLNRLI